MDRVRVGMMIKQYNQVFGDKLNMELRLTIPRSVTEKEKMKTVPVCFIQSE